MFRKIICKKEDCTGCCACYNICPKNCITMEEDELGYIRPIVDETICISCNLCINICPVNKKVETKESRTVYAVWNLDEKDRENSSSGGVATVLAKYIIQNRGIVFGCKIDKNLNVVYDYGQTNLDIEKFKGSKYVQGYVGNTYQKVKENLDQGKNVIFFGTPCHVAGLKNYLQKDYLKLITVDLVCHGVPPEKYLKEHVEYVRKNKKNTITNLSFRGKYDFMFTLYSNNDVVYQNSNWKDLYFRGFTYGLYHRDSCYKCKYSNPSRVSDLTIGDFHGLGSKVKFNNNGVKKVSLLMINTSKGQELFRSCKNMIFYEKRTVEECVEGNAQLRRPSVKHKNVGKFKKLYLHYGFERSAKKCLRKEIILDKFSRAKGKIKLLIKHYL